MSNPYERKNGGDHGQRAEKRTAKRFNARLTPGSGSKIHSKGDMVLPEFLLENKSTIHESFSVKLDVLRKISREALEKAREPVLAIQFVDALGKPVERGRWVMVREDFFRELTTSEDA